MGPLISLRVTLSKPIELRHPTSSLSPSPFNEYFQSTQFGIVQNQPEPSRAHLRSGKFRVTASR